MLRVPALSPLRKREAGIGQEGKHLQGGGRGWVRALPRTGYFPLGLSFLACPEGEHTPCLTSSKGLNEAFVRERVWKSFANCEAQCTQAG